MQGLILTARKFPVTLGVAVTLDGVGVISPEGVILSAGQELQQADSAEALASGAHNRMFHAGVSALGLRPAPPPTPRPFQSGPTES